MTHGHPNQQWAVVRRMVSGRPEIVRFRESVATWSDSFLYPVRFVVIWDYQSAADPEGLPDLGASADMAAFEDEMKIAIDRPGIAVFTMVTTSNGRREWIFHAVDLRKVVAAIEARIDLAKLVPVRFDAAVDTSWSEVRRRVAFAES